MPPPCVAFCRVAVSVRGPGQSPVLPFACCVGSLRSVGRCGRCSRWCRFRVSGAQSLAYWGLCLLLRGSFYGFCLYTPPPRSGRPPHCLAAFPCVRGPKAPPPPRVVLVVRPLPHRAAMCVRPNHSISARGTRGGRAHLHGFRGCPAHLRTTAPGHHRWGPWPGTCVGPTRAVGGGAVPSGA